MSRNAKLTNIQRETAYQASLTKAKMKSSLSLKKPKGANLPPKLKHSHTGVKPYSKYIKPGPKIGGLGTSCKVKSVKSKEKSNNMSPSGAPKSVSNMSYLKSKRAGLHEASENSSVLHRSRPKVAAQTSRNKYIKKSKSISQSDPMTLKIDTVSNRKFINILDLVSNPSHNDSKCDQKAFSSSSDYFHVVNHKKRFSKDKRSNS